MRFEAKELDEVSRRNWSTGQPVSRDALAYNMLALGEYPREKALCVKDSASLCKLGSNRK
jgi:hypothetical protein